MLRLPMVLSSVEQVTTTFYLAPALKYLGTRCVKLYHLEWSNLLLQKAIHFEPFFYSYTVELRSQCNVIFASILYRFGAIYGTQIQLLLQNTTYVYSTKCGLQIKRSTPWHAL